jgi:hypothetical protein
MCRNHPMKVITISVSIVRFLEVNVFLGYLSYFMYIT